MRLEVKKIGSEIGFKAAQAEVKKINQRLKEIDQEVRVEQEAQLAPLRNHYQKRLEAITSVSVEPWDKMFETEADYRARKQKAEGEVDNRRTMLRSEKRVREAEIEKEFAKLLTMRLQKFLEQREFLTSKKYVLKPPEVSFKLKKYDPYDETFSVDFVVGSETFDCSAKIAKEKARRYWQNPTLLLPLVTMKISESGEGEMVEQVLLAPGNEHYLARLKNFTDSATGMEFVWVPGGCFQMGSNRGDADEKPVHKVCVDGFYIGKYEVTQGQWRKLMGNNPARFKKGDNYPVEQVSWDDCQLFVRKLNGQSNKTFRLPTEAEWEYACRSGGRDEQYSGGNDIDRVAWYSSNSRKSTRAVGGKAVNGLGLYDMSGNVWEWCSDWYDSNYYQKSPRQNPQGPDSGSYRVARGGGWCYGPRRVRSANRFMYWPSNRISNLGFRLVSPGRR